MYMLKFFHLFLNILSDINAINKCHKQKQILNSAVTKKCVKQIIIFYTVYFAFDEALHTLNFFLSTRFMSEYHPGGFIFKALNSLSLLAVSFKWKIFCLAKAIYFMQQLIIKIGFETEIYLYLDINLIIYPWSFKFFFFCIQYSMQISLTFWAHAPCGSEKQTNHDPISLSFHFL